MATLPTTNGPLISFCSIYLKGCRSRQFAYLSIRVDFHVFTSTKIWHTPQAQGIRVGALLSWLSHALCDHYVCDIYIFAMGIWCVYTSRDRIDKYPSNVILYLLYSASKYYSSYLHFQQKTNLSIPGIEFWRRSHPPSKTHAQTMAWVPRMLSELGVESLSWIAKRKTGNGERVVFVRILVSIESRNPVKQLLKEKKLWKMSGWRNINCFDTFVLSISLHQPLLKLIDFLGKGTLTLCCCTLHKQMARTMASQLHCLMFA